MSGISRFALPFFGFILLTSAVVAQEDLPREQGLPTRIGGSRCDGARPGSIATVQGTFNVTGLQNSGTPPKLSVALYAAGMYVSRQRVKNGGTFYFYCVPDQSVTLIAEIDSTEVGNYSVGNLAPPPQTNYQDIYVSWSSVGDTLKQKNEVISVRNSYSRTPENQKAFEKAMERLREKNGEATAKMLGDLLEKDPADFVAWTELGNIQFNHGRFDDAINSYDKALTLKPDFTAAMFGAGRANLSARKLDRSIELLSRALSMNPDSADINHYLGEAHLQNKKGSLAIVYMRRAMELAPDTKADLHLRLGWLFDAAGAKDQAAEEYKQFLQRRPNYPQKDKLQQYRKENAK
jgi:tetratricopeptide (TPR) repeat protein